jgi:nicotinamide-nucleotide amidase
MNAITLSIGNELVLGQTVDTNSAWLSQRLASLGIDCVAHITVGDDQSAIAGAIKDAPSRCDLLLITGGLGPTKDDLTRQAIAEVLGQPLEMNALWLSRMEAIFARLKRVMVESNRIQAMIPRSAEMIENSAGTAAGIGAVLSSCKIFAMPGVPAEMRAMFDRMIAPRLSSSSESRVILSRTLHTFGMGESAVGEMLGELMDRGRNPLVGTTVSGGIVSVRITARESSPSLVQQKLDQTAEAVHAALGDLVYGQDDQTLPGAIAALLIQPTLKTVTTAESCTGGLLAKMLTDIPGSSEFFQRGWITYSNEAKTEMLGVDPALIADHGAVSEPVVAAMAVAARRKSNADFALAISGIAGPGGGTPAKPVGTVCIALAHSDGQIARTFGFSGDRQMIRERSAKMALTLLRYHILGKTVPFQEGAGNAFRGRK